MNFIFVLWNYQLSLSSLSVSRFSPNQIDFFSWSCCLYTRVIQIHTKGRDRDRDRDRKGIGHIIFRQYEIPTENTNWKWKTENLPWKSWVVGKLKKNTYQKQVGWKEHTTTSLIWTAMTAHSNLSTQQIRVIVWV